MRGISRPQATTGSGRRLVGFRDPRSRVRRRSVRDAAAVIGLTQVEATEVDRPTGIFDKHVVSYCHGSGHVLDWPCRHHQELPGWDVVDAKHALVVSAGAEISPLDRYQHRSRWNQPRVRSHPGTYGEYRRG